jgi:hypothetical protein
MSVNECKLDLGQLKTADLNFARDNPDLYCNRLDTLVCANLSFEQLFSVFCHVPCGS